MTFFLCRTTQGKSSFPDIFSMMTLPEMDSSTKSPFFVKNNTECEHKKQYSSIKIATTIEKIDAWPLDYCYEHDVVGWGNNTQ